jgi:hypothetical protein
MGAPSHIFAPAGGKVYWNVHAGTLFACLNVEKIFEQDSNSKEGVFLTK